MNAVVVAPSDSNVIWAANSAGVYRSADGGATWTNTNGPIDVLFLVVHPADANRAWAWSKSAGLYRTDDGGATWTALHALTNTDFPTGLAIDPQNPDTMYAAGDCYHTLDATFVPGNGVYKSTDGGATWTFIPPQNGGPSLCTMELSLDPFSPWRIFTHGGLGGYIESYDGAHTWLHTFDDRPSRGVLFDPRFPFTHYGLTSVSFLVSQDGGFTWATANANLPAVPRALTIDPQRGRLFLGTTNGMFRSGDGGRVWAGTQLPQTNVNALGFARTPDVLFAGTTLGLFEVVNHGLGEAQPIDLHDISVDLDVLAVDPSDGNFVYAATRDGRVYRSADAGASWQAIPIDGNLIVDSISVGAGGTVYAVARSRTLYRRGRDDDHWTAVPLDHAGAVAADPKTPGTLFVSGSFGVERSRDFGATWQQLHVIGGIIAIQPDDPRWVYVADVNHIYRSGDGGDTWTDAPNANTGNIFPAANGVLYRTGTAGPERSDDRGITWRAATLPNRIPAGTLAIDPRDPNSLWASTDPLYFSSTGLFHSTDGGATWTPVNGPFGTPTFANAIRFDPSGSVVHFALPNHGVWELR